MLYVVFGREHCDSIFYLDTRIYFKQNKKPEWFEDSFVKEFLKEIDGSEVLFEEALKDYKGRGISTDKISTGCKTLCCLYYQKEKLWFYGSGLGNNCLPFLLKICRKKDVYLYFEHYPRMPEEFFTESLVSYKGKIIDHDEFDDAYANWCEEGKLLIESGELDG